jgi:hypothetical protein
MATSVVGTACFGAPRGIDASLEAMSGVAGTELVGEGEDCLPIGVLLTETRPGVGAGLPPRPLGIGEDALVDTR